MTLHTWFILLLILSSILQFSVDQCLGQAAHTTPIYVTINGNGFLNPETCDSYLELNEKYLDELEAELDTPHENLEYRAYWYRKGLKSRIATTRQVIEKLKNK